MPKPEIPLEHVIALYDTALYCVFLPIFGSETLETSPQIMILHIKNALQVSNKDHDTLLERVVESCNFDHVLLQVSEATIFLFVVICISDRLS